ncbi:MAG: hypothetical protein QM831_13140 [Kofleriaceae bacterium]
MQVRNLSTTIAVPLARAYDFAHRPDNFPKWAEGMTADARVDYTPKNEYGILDHRVHVGDKVIYVPLRMIANGDGTEVVFTLFREPEMSDADFARDEAMVVKDLANLKALLEK